MLFAGVALGVVAFPIGIGLAFVFGTIWLYLQHQDTTKAGMLFAGVALGVVAVLFASQMYRTKGADERKRAKEPTRSKNDMTVAEEKVQASIDLEKAEALKNQPSFAFTVVLLCISGMLMSGWAPISSFGTMTAQTR